MICDELIDGVCNAISLKVLGVESKEVPKTLKIKGRVDEFPLFILFDNGASHNFASRKLVEAIGWKWKNTKDMKILLGNKHLLKSCGVCNGLIIEVEAVVFILDAYLFDL